MSRSQKHTHKYHLVDIDYDKVWACALPECNHFMPPHYTRLLPGKASICWECGDKFILTEQNMTQVQPKCTNCDLSYKEINSLLQNRGV